MSSILFGRTQQNLENIPHAKQIHLTMTDRTPQQQKIDTIFSISHFPEPIDLLNLEQYGRVLNCRILKKKDGTSSGKAYVQFEKVEDAHKAFEALKDKIIDGQRISVNEFRAVDENSKDLPQPNTIFVESVSPEEYFQDVIVNDEFAIVFAIKPSEKKRTRADLENVDQIRESQKADHSITVIGVTLNNVQYVKEYFRKLTVDEPKFNDENVLEDNMDWMSIDFSRNPSSILGIKPVISITPNNDPLMTFTITCLAGKFGNPIQEKHSRKEVSIYRVLKNGENTAYMPWEDKPFMVKVKEFLFGMGEMRVNVKSSSK